MEKVPAGYIFPQYSMVWKTAIGFVLTACLKFFVNQACYPMAYAISKVQDDEEMRVKYAKKACNFFSGFIYFTVSASYGWSVMKDTPYLPWYLGGLVEGAGLHNVKLDTLYFEYDVAILDYSLYTFGFHIYNFYAHIFIDPHVNDFEEMLLHHIAAFCLYFCYIFGNLVPLGAPIAFLHDLADIPGNLCKSLNST